MASLPELKVRITTERDPDHVCPLEPVGDDEATLALVEILRVTGSASQVVARLAVRGLAVGRMRG